MIIDLSSNQGTVDFKKLKEAGVTDVILRTSMGYNTEDKMVKSYSKGAIDNGLNISYYHFAYPDMKIGSTVESDAIAEATYFVKCIKELPTYKNLVVDLEQETLLNKNDFQTWVKTWLDTVEKLTTTQPIIYTYTDYLNRHLASSHPFGSFRLWIANYSAKENPPLPTGWNKYFMWQYTEKGHVDGISTTVDISKLNT